MAPTPRQWPGVETFKQRVALYHHAFPDVRFSVEDDSKVAWRWRYTGAHQGEFGGIAPTGRRVDVTGVIIIHIANGKIAE